MLRRLYHINPGMQQQKRSRVPEFHVSVCDSINARFFVEVFPNNEQVQHATERWFFQVTKSEIVNNSVRGNWCNADCLTITNQAEESLHLGDAKDYGQRSLFIQK
jgi:hypothetical protein